MRRWRYLEQGPTDEPVVVTVSEQEILATYYPWWQAQMRKVGKADQISPERCLEDYVVVNWATEVLDDENSQGQ